MAYFCQNEPNSITLAQHFQRSSAMTAPIVVRVLVGASSILPPSFVTERRGEFVLRFPAAETVSAFTGALSPERVTTRRSRSSSGWRLPISAYRNIALLRPGLIECGAMVQVALQGGA